MSNCTHHFIIGFDNVGRCRYCPEVRDFGRLLEREGVFEARGRGAKARVEALGQKRARKKHQPAAIAKISAAVKKRWQNPEYRGKQRAAHKKEELLYEERITF